MFKSLCYCTDNTDNLNHYVTDLMHHPWTHQIQLNEFIVYYLFTANAGILG